MNRQETLWAGAFGDRYASRNSDPRLLAAKTALLARIVSRCGPLASAIEFGPNIGLNLLALKALCPAIALTAVEINPRAQEELRTIPGLRLVAGSVLGYEPRETFDLAFTMGLLIHLHPDDLPAAYEVLFRSSHRFVLVAEYYNPTPVEIDYRGEKGALFKRDFAGDLLDRFPGLRVVDYGFAWRRDPAFAHDDLSWFLLERRREA